VPDSDQSTTLTDVWVTYEAARVQTRKVVGLTRNSCGQTDLRNAADKMGILKPGKFVMPADERQFRMLCDLALFEANDRGVRPIDRFLAGPARTLPVHEQDLARRLGGAFFSLFRLTAKHDAGDFCAEDILNRDRHIRIVTTSLEDREAGPEVFAMRLFDTGQFHMAITVILSASDKFVQLCLTGQNATGHIPFRRGLAATMYGLHFLEGTPNHLSKMKFARDVAHVFESFKASASVGEGETARGP
jgi:hypothetical protein